ncbi:hypothetical protein H4R18_005745 [Coemansia javaensis]|uniref:Lysozyme n=1 Tax=Coemansia javaensis TaxID=2761396 RepID=A0A9W8H7M3_9FUNG|nr:hypothetical protein H4R18_005745 [Coemansia javaensis]
MWFSPALALVAGACAVAAGPGYPITADGVKCRAGPSTNHGVVKVYSKGQQVSIGCQAAGLPVFGTALWDRTGDGCYVSDHYVKTGSSGYVAQRCAAPAFCRGLSAAGAALVKQWEGFVASPAPDPVGLPSVGYGHQCQQKDCAEVPYRLPLTPAAADRLLRRDIREYTTCLAAMLNAGVRLNANQWNALASWVYNVGCAQAAGSTLIRRLAAAKEDPNSVAAQELPKWKYAGGKVFQGLVDRRNAEVRLFKTPTSRQGFPTCT